MTCTRKRKLTTGLNWPLIRLHEAGHAGALYERITEQLLALTEEELIAMISEQCRALRFVGSDGRKGDAR